MRWWMVGVLGLVATAEAFAQGYICTRSNGTRFFSNTPCPPPGLVIYGPTQSQPSRPTYFPPAPPADEELQYMSAECSTLSEGVRTAASRGLSHHDIATLRRDFQTKCGENQAEARRRLYQEKQEESKVKNEQRQQAEKQLSMSKEEDDRRRVQCAEMRTSIANRKARVNLSDGEKNDLAIFEQRYRDRCF